MITHDQALKFLNEQIENKNIVKHMLATEAIMRTLAKHLESEKEDKYATAGLLHDGDYREDVPHQKQGVKVTETLRKKGFDVPDDVAHTMAAHNRENTGVKPETKMDWSLFICDSLTGLIVATALVRPDKKLSSVTVKSVLKKFKTPSFAAGTRREDIKLCQEKLGLSLDEFIALSLKAMQKIAPDLGL